jgi:excisionase family DNA binding protein
MTTTRHDWLTLRQAARRAGLSERQVRAAHARGEIVSYQFGGWTRVRWADFAAWIESRRRPARSAGEAR